jgi:hypothetical protein
LIYLDIMSEFQNNAIIPKKCKTLSLIHSNKLLNNLPEHIEKIYIDRCNILKDMTKQYNFIDNLPITIKEIIVPDEFTKNLLKNVPFETLVIVEK